MSRSGARATYLAGLRDGLPFILAVGPFGLLFGVVGTEAGLDIAQVMGFSIVVIAGASQLTAVQLLSDHAPTLVLLATALAVNLRMAMYSASLAPYIGAMSLRRRALAAYLLVDQSYTLGVQKFEDEPQMTLAERAGYYFGVASGICPFWIIATFLGAVLGARMPAGLGIDFAAPITFIAMFAPMFRTLAHVAAGLTSVVLALALAGLPYGSGLLIAALAALAAGAAVETAMERRAAA